MQPEHVAISCHRCVKAQLPHLAAGQEEAGQPDLAYNLCLVLLQCRRICPGQAPRNRAAAEQGILCSAAGCMAIAEELLLLRNMTVAWLLLHGTLAIAWLGLLCSMTVAGHTLLYSLSVVRLLVICLGRLIGHGCNPTATPHGWLGPLLSCCMCPALRRRTPFCDIEWPLMAKNVAGTLHIPNTSPKRSVLWATHGLHLPFLLCNVVHSCSKQKETDGRFRGGTHDFAAVILCK